MSNLKKHLQSCKDAISTENNNNSSNNNGINSNINSSSTTEEQIKKLLKPSCEALMKGGLNKLLQFS